MFPGAGHGEGSGADGHGISSPTLPEYWLKNHGRETLGWMKYLLQKYLHLPLERE